MAVKVLATPDVATLTDGATVNTDASLARLFRLTAAGDRTLAAPTNAVDGMYRIWEITASAAQRAITLATGSSGTFELTIGISSPITIASGKTHFIGAVYSSARSRWTVIASRQLA